MTKTYKHKKLGLVAYRISSVEYRCEMVDKIKTWYYLPAKLIENSDDWELQTEKDWIDELKDDIMGLYKLHVKNPPHEGLIKEDYENMWKDIKFHIEKHIPKITKKELEEEEEEDWVWGEQIMAYRLKVIQLLKDKLLYKE